MGPRDLENGTVEIARRDTKEKASHSIDGVADKIEKLLTDIQENLYNKASNYRDEHITEANSWDEFKDLLEIKMPCIAHWNQNHFVVVLNKPHNLLQQVN